MRLVDAQIHLWENDKAPPHHWRAPFRIDDAIGAMDTAGVARAINCPPNWDPQSNDYAAEAARLHPDRFATMGWFDLGQPRDRPFLERWLEQPGMIGLRFIFFTAAHAVELASGRLDWLWRAADDLGVPVALGVAPELLGAVELLAPRFPNMRLMVDHLGVHPLAKLPDAFNHLDTLTAMARYPNVAVKATAVPSMSNAPYPFEDTHAFLRQIFDAFGPERMFWGTDFTRMRCDWQACIDLFTHHLSWLSGDDLDRVMGGALCDWIGWR